MGSTRAHTSIAHDDLELVIDGASVWENYVIEIDLEYQSYDGEKEEDWSIDVGDWTSEYHQGWGIHILLKPELHTHMLIESRNFLCPMKRGGPC